MKKKGLLLILVALVCLLFVTPVNKQVNAEGVNEVTLTFNNTAKRTSLSSDKQVWEENGIVFTNNKAASTNAIVDNSNPVRLYANSEFIVEYPGMTQIVFDCNSSSYATALKNSIGSSATANSDKVTVKFDDAQDSFTVAKLTAQVRLDSLTITYQGEGIDVEDLTPKYIQNMVDEYSNDGNYTKKSYINVSEAAFAEIQGFDINSLFVGGARLDRTTYYWPTELLMTEIDGDFEGYNSGYGTDDNGNLTQFKVDAAGNKLSEKFSANKSHPNWDDTNKDGMEGFYVTLDDMLADGYFEGWDYSEEIATYKVESNRDVFAKDFVAFVAPCLEPIMVEDTYKNYFIIDKLEITAGDHYIFGEYLRFRIYVGSDCSGTVDNKDLVLAEAHIYVGNEKQFDENIDVRPTLTLEALEIIKDQFDGQTFSGNKALTKKTKTNGYENYNPYVFLTWTYDDGAECPDVIEATDEVQELTLYVSASISHENFVEDYVSDPVEVTFTIEAKPEQAQSLLATFEFGANGSASHSDGSSGSSYTETNSGYTLNITSCSNLYKNARDAMGNSCLKFGTGSKAGSMTFTVADDVNYVVIYVAAYKAKTASVTINKNTTTLTTKSDNGQYDVIVIDTTTTKTISFNVSSGYRAMVNTIEFYSSYPEGK